MSQYTVKLALKVFFMKTIYYNHPGVMLIMFIYVYNYLQPELNSFFTSMHIFRESKELTIRCAFSLKFILCFNICFQLFPKEVFL